MYTFNEKRTIGAEGHAPSVEVSRYQGSGQMPFLMASSVMPKEWVAGSYLELVAAIIRSGLRSEGPDYLRSEGGQYWCWMGNLEPDAVIRVALNQGAATYQRYYRGQAEILEDGARTFPVTLDLC